MIDCFPSCVRLRFDGTFVLITVLALQGSLLGM
jgi:hypothetical protein